MCFCCIYVLNGRICIQLLFPVLPLSSCELWFLPGAYYNFRILDLYSRLITPLLARNTSKKERWTSEVMRNKTEVRLSSSIVSCLMTPLNWWTKRVPNRKVCMGKSLGEQFQSHLTTFNEPSSCCWHGSKFVPNAHHGNASHSVSALWCFYTSVVQTDLVKRRPSHAMSYATRAPRGKERKPALELEDTGSLHRSGSKMIGNKEGTWQTNGREGKGTSWWDRCTRAQIRDNYGDCWLKHVQASFNTTQARKKEKKTLETPGRQEWP